MSTMESCVGCGSGGHRPLCSGGFLNQQLDGLSGVTASTRFGVATCQTAMAACGYRYIMLF